MTEDFCDSLGLEGQCGCDVYRGAEVENEKHTEKILHHKVEGMSRRIFKAQQTFSKLLASLMAVGTFEIEKHNMLLKDILSSSKDTYVMFEGHWHKCFISLTPCPRDPFYYIN